MQAKTVRHALIELFCGAMLAVAIGIATGLAFAVTFNT